MTQTSPLTIAVTDNARLWVFSLHMTADEVATLSGPIPAADSQPDPVAALLGVDDLDRTYVEIFDLADLTGLGLAGYLTTGNGIPLSQLVPDRARLDALRGPVLILFAPAFANRPVTLNPDPRLSLIGSYAEDMPPVEFEPLPNADAKGSLAPPRSDDMMPDQTASQSAGTVPDAPKPAKKYSDARMSGMVATYALLVMFAMVSLMIWIA